MLRAMCGYRAKHDIASECAREAFCFTDRAIDERASGVPLTDFSKHLGIYGHR